MTFAARFGILFVLTLIAMRASRGVIIEEHWYSFFWALFVGFLNASIRAVFIVKEWRCTWSRMVIVAIVLNIILFWILYLGGLRWLGITANVFGSALLAAVIVAAGSSICNHFIGFKGPDK